MAATMSDSDRKTLRPAPASPLAIFGMLILALAISAMLGIIALVTMPCAWFGSSFEGGCGLGAMLATFAVAVPLSIVLFLGLLTLYLRRRATGSPAALSKISERNVRLWIVTFWLVMSIFFTISIFSQTGFAMIVPVYMLAVVHGFFIYQVAKGLPAGQAIWLPLVAILHIPVTTLGVFLYLYWLRKKQRAGEPVALTDKQQ